jgi:exodeoxyribonuclease III
MCLHSVGSTEVMKLVTFNINGIRATNRKGSLKELIDKYTPDVICLQEIRCSEEHIVPCIRDVYTDYPHVMVTCHSKKGYAGVALISKIAFDTNFIPPELHYIFHGRLNICRLETGEVLLNAYVMNSQARHTEKWEQRIKLWDVEFNKLVQELQTMSEGRLLVCGDFNIADECHPAIYYPDMGGVTQEERDSFKLLLSQTSLIDMVPTTPCPAFTCFPTPRFRNMNIGMRIDYILVEEALAGGKTTVLYDIYGSDHIPVMYEYA